jgi:signal transduction histidine kinase
MEISTQSNNHERPTIAQDKRRYGEAQGRGGSRKWACGSRVSAWLAQAMQEGRAALNSLRTTTQPNDLTEALRRVTEDGLIPSSMKSAFSVVGDAREMDPIFRDEVFRIGYEAIRNACTHSGASRLEVELRYAGDRAPRRREGGFMN